MKCRAHPEIETSLRCSKCGEPICPKCLVQTPVGARCQQCAHLSQLPTYQVSSLYYLRAFGAALGMAIVSGIIWGALQSLLPFLYLNLLLAGGVGYAVAEMVRLSVNRKRSRSLATIGSIAVIISYLINILTLGSIPSGLFSLSLDFIALALGVFVAVNRLR